jgi:DNA invertase Pin-like site-specific DNA recombinase
VHPRSCSVLLSMEQQQSGLYAKVSKSIRGTPARYGQTGSMVPRDEAVGGGGSVPTRRSICGQVSHFDSGRRMFVLVTLTTTFVDVGATPMKTGRFIAYYRVSTKRQGQSGLGLEAQQQLVHQYLNGGKWQLVQEVIEIESGGNNDRAKLKEAIRLCRAWRATLVIAKLDRLSRSVKLIADLMEEGVQFVVAESPEMTHLTVHIMAAVAEHERRAISDRTKAALAAAKRRGTRLGGDRGGLTKVTRSKGTSISVAVRVDKAKRTAQDLLAVINRLREQGIGSAKGIAKALNKDNTPTPSGKGQWQTTTVQRVLRRVA